MLFFMFLGFDQAQAVSTEYNCTHNSNHKCVSLKGYAWGADNSPFGGIGWINFNNGPTNQGGSNTSNGVTYKVEFDRDDQTLQGYAWSERYGYIKFGGFTEGNGKYPNSNACAGGTNSDATCNAKLVSAGTGYQMTGYARFCFVYQSGCSGTLRPASELGGYDGWIAFKGTSNNWGVSYSTTSNTFQGYAWAGGSGDKSSSQYGSGSGWVKMNPTGGGISCYLDKTSNPSSDCLDDSDKPIVTLTASPNPAKYNENVTLSWNVTNIPSGCTADTSSSPSVSSWDNYTPGTGGFGVNDFPKGSLNIGSLTQPTTFTLSCTYNGKKATDDVLVDLSSYIPQVTLTAPATVTYGQTAQIDYTVTNIPYGCNSAILYSNGTQVDTATINNSGGLPTYTATGSFTRNITAVNNWEFRCTDNTAPSPARVGSATAKTSPVVPSITMSLSVKDKTTNKTATTPGSTGILNIPCTNTGIDITYSAGAAANIKSCRAMIGGSGTDPDWGDSTSLTIDGSPHTVTINNITATGEILYGLQCRRLDNSPVTYNVRTNRSCTPGSLSVTAAAACVTPADNVVINYSGSGLVSGSCTKSWGGQINQSTFNLNYIRPASTLTVGQTYTYSVDSCQDISDPNGTPLSSSVSVDIKNTCGGGTTCTGSSLRCKIQNGIPVFKEF